MLTKLLRKNFTAIQSPESTRISLNRSEYNCVSRGAAKAYSLGRKPQDPVRHNHPSPGGATPIRSLAVIALATLCLSPHRIHADQQQLLSQASKAALRHVADSVVQIQTLGGQEKVGGMLVGTGPTTGLIVREDGYIISSAFNFKHDPPTILVTLANGKNLPAKIVSRDKSRMVVLLKVDSESSLPVPNMLNRNQITNGQYALAMGRTYESELPSISIGIISATNRIWGKAIQTDAKVSPANYGGPLTDLRGRVMGVLVPLSAQNTSEVAGAEYYDGGIGFAVPIEDISRMLPTMVEGETIMPGKLGVTIKGSDLYAVGPPEIAFCPVRSPAAKAGFRKGDKIKEIDGQVIDSQAQLKHAIGPRIAGETISLVVDRDGENYRAEFELTEKVEPYVLPVLGILPLASAADSTANGKHANEENAAYPLEVAFVIADSAADKAGLEAGDTLISLDGYEPTSLDDWRQRIALMEIGSELNIGYRPKNVDADELKSVKLSLETQDAIVPTELPRLVAGEASRTEDSEVEDTAELVSLSELKLPEEPNECLVIVPNESESNVPVGILIWLGTPGAEEEETLRKRFSTLCHDHALIVMAPQPVDKKRWKRDEMATIRKMVDKLVDRYRVNPHRVIVHGSGVGGALGYAFAFDNRDIVRGVAPTNAVIPLVGTIRGNDPFERLEFFVFGCEKTRVRQRMSGDVEKLQTFKFPLVERWVTGEERYFDDDELNEFGRWTRTLERL